MEIRDAPDRHAKNKNEEKKTTRAFIFKTNKQTKTQSDNIRT